MKEFKENLKSKLIRVDAEVHKLAKLKAAEKQVSMYRLVNELVRSLIRHKKHPENVSTDNE